MAFQIGPVASLRGIDPNSFVRRTPDLTGISGDPFVNAATALTGGLMEAEQKMRDRLEADRLYSLQARQFEQGVREFGQVHELNQKEAENLAEYRNGSLELQGKGQDLAREQFQTQKSAIELDMEFDRAKLKDFRDRSERETNSYKSFQETIESFKRNGGIASGPLTTFSHVGNLKDLEDNGIGFDGNSTANVPGVSINQEMFEAAFPGENKASIRNNFEVDIIDEDTGEVKGTLPIVDRGPHKSIIAKKGAALDVTAAGILELGGELLTNGNAIVGHTLTGNHTFRVRKKSDAGKSAAEADFLNITTPIEADAGGPERVKGIQQQAPQEPDLVGLHDYLKSVEEDPFAGDETRAQAHAERQRMASNPKVAAHINGVEAAEFANKFPMPDFVANEFVRRASRHPKLLSEGEFAQMAKIVTEMGADAIAAQTPDYNKPIAETLKKTTALRSAVEDITRLESTLKSFENGKFFGVTDRKGRIEGGLIRLLDKAVEQEDVALIGSAINSMVPNLARGVFGEVGVLTDKDVERYRQLLPTNRDSKSLQVALLALLKEKLRDAIITDIDAAETIRGEDPEAIREFYRRGGVDPDNLDSLGGSKKPINVNAGGNNILAVPQANGMMRLAPVK